MALLNSRSVTLTSIEIDKFFTDHLKYRLYMLETHSQRKNGFQTDSAILTCMLESSLIACRVLMEFLGLGIKNSIPPVLEEHRKYYSQDGTSSFEVKVVDLGGEFVDINNSLTNSEKDLLAKVFLSAHRATAHLTEGSPFTPDANLVSPATTIIRRLLKEYLEDKTNRTITK